MPYTLAPPLVSVLMPAYNHAPYVRAAVESVLEQTYDNLELIAIDDASSDATWEVLQTFADARLRLYRHVANQGAHATLNEALALAKGEFIAIINSDDVYYPERLQRAVSCLAGNQSLGACFSRYDFIDETGGVVRDSASLAREFPDAVRGLGPAAEVLDRNELQVLSLLARNYLHTTSNLVCRRQVFEHIGQFRGFRYVHDHDFFLRLCQRYPIEVIQESLLGYRFHATNTLAESAVASVAETAAMLAEFFLTQELKPMRQSHPAFLEVLGYLLRNLRAYGADRLVLLLVLAEADRPQRSEIPMFLPWALDESIRHQVGTLRDNDRAADDLRWQKTQTTKWWEETQKSNAKRSRVISKLQETRQSLRRSEQQLAWWRDKYQRTLTARIRRTLRRLLDMANKVTRNTNQ